MRIDRVTDDSLGVLGFFCGGEVMTVVEDRGAERTSSSLLEYYRPFVRSAELARLNWREQGRFRLDFNGREGNGRVECLRFSNGLTLTVSDYFSKQSLSKTHLPTPLAFGFVLLLAGGYEVSSSFGEATHRVAPGRIWRRAGDIPGMVTTTIPQGTRVRGISIGVSQSMAEEWRNETSRSLSLGVGRLVSDTESAFSPIMSVNDVLRGPVAAILGQDLGTVLGRLRAESSALEVLAHVLSLSGGDDKGPRNSGNRMWKALDEAVDILSAEWLTPPTISCLARRVGTNECYLKAGFRERFGTTVASYVRTIRMREARRLIEVEGWTVQQAAVEVGFSNPSKFTAAFRRTHGLNPSALKGSLPK